DPGEGPRHGEHPLQRRPHVAKPSRLAEGGSGQGGDRNGRSFRTFRRGLRRKLPHAAGRLRAVGRQLRACRDGGGAGPVHLGRNLGRALREGSLPGGGVRPCRQDHAPGGRAGRSRADPSAEGGLRPCPEGLFCLTPHREDAADTAGGNPSTATKAHDAPLWPWWLKRMARIPSQTEIPGWIAENPRLSAKRDIAKAFRIKGAERIEPKRLLKEPEAEGTLERRRKT